MKKEKTTIKVIYTNTLRNKSIVFCDVYDLPYGECFVWNNELYFFERVVF